MSGILDAELERFRARLWSEDLRYVPVRHHSPACAEQVRRLFRSDPPARVLVEGPRDFNALIPLLFEDDCRYPLAFYSLFIDEQRRTANPYSEFNPQDAPRYAAYFPFCVHSPELVALQEGHRVGAKLEFIDVPHAQRVLHEKEGGELLSAQACTLMGEAQERESELLSALCEKLECRDRDELWDKLFEAGSEPEDPQRFFAQVAGYGWILRQGMSTEDLELRGSWMRERYMAHKIAQARSELSKGEWMLVLTGAFHVAGVMQLLDSCEEPAKTLAQPEPEFQEGEEERYLIPYSSVKLDGWAGYGAGMPSPGYYEKLWNQPKEARGEALHRTALELLLGVARESRKRPGPTVSTAEVLAAARQANDLAALRGHAGPSRSDLLDAMHSSFVKGPLDSEGRFLSALVRDLLRGDSVGRNPKKADRLPLVVDFYRHMEALSLGKSRSSDLDRRLDIYRSHKDRQRSRFAHRVRFLVAGYAEKVSGPDWTAGVDMERLFERWRFRWSPEVETDLIDASVWGGSLEAAASAKLAKEFDPSSEYYDASTQQGVRLLVSACEMGLHANLAPIIQQIAHRIPLDGDFGSLVSSIRWLKLAQLSWDPLSGSQRKEDFSALLVSAYERACYLLNDLHCKVDDSRSEIIDHLQFLSELIGESGEEELDQELFFEPLLDLATDADREAELQGAALGILVRMDKMEPERIEARLEGALSLGCGGVAALGLLQGLLRCYPAVAWNHDFLVNSLDQALQNWGGDDFLQAVPYLRLAFSVLTPRQIHRVAKLVAQRYQSFAGALRAPTKFSPGELEAHLEIEAKVRQGLESDGLLEWMELN